MAYGGDYDSDDYYGEDLYGDYDEQSDSPSDNDDDYQEEDGMIYSNTHYYQLLHTDLSSIALYRVTILSQ